MVPMLGIEMIIYMSVKMGGPMKPWSSTNEDAIYKPCRAVISVGRAIVRRIIIIAVGAIRGRADLHRHLSVANGSRNHKT